MRQSRYILRPVGESDSPGIWDLVATIQDSLTSLPKDPDFLNRRILDSLRAFDPRVHRPGGEGYLFVLEDLRDRRIVGTSGILSRVGGFDPFYTYEIRREKQAYAPLGIDVLLETLHLKKNHKGPTEICSLYLHPDHRAGGMGRLLSLARFLFMKSFPERFDHEVLAELRGFIDPEGHSPFWEAVGQKFFQNDYYTADILSGVGEKAFIEALMPRYPIYISLLPESARAVIGRVHPHTEAARGILLKEGFRETSEVDIFDAGPILIARREALRTWHFSRESPVQTGEPEAGVTALVSNGLLDFRATIGRVQLEPDGSLLLGAELLEVLQIEPGQKACWLPMEGPLKSA